MQNTWNFLAKGGVWKYLKWDLQIPLRYWMIQMSEMSKRKWNSTRIITRQKQSLVLILWACLRRGYLNRKTESLIPSTYKQYSRVIQTNAKGTQLKRKIRYWFCEEKHKWPKQVDSNMYIKQVLKRRDSHTTRIVQKSGFN